MSGRAGVPSRSRRWRALGLTLLVVGAGLALRGLGPRLGLPFVATKYGGSVLWGAMVYGVAAALAPAAGEGRLAAVAGSVAALVEASRLLHTPALDAFRLTFAGASLLGRVFSPWNLLAYAVGIAAAWAMDAACGADR